ncbi:MAG TPA: SRPBCC family protein [Saprospiraceae bacterium]|nr:SRPBCC family protein [Saprospiraceae bacterium]
MKEIQNDRELVFERLLNAPRSLVFKVWTDPEHIVQWWGPNGFTNTNHGMDVSQNGVWRFTMHGPDGTDYKNKIVFLEVTAPERIVYRHADDEDKESIHFHVTVTFEARENKTLLTMRMVFDTREELERVAREYGAIEGAHQTIARLDAYVADAHIGTADSIPFTITRRFDAPRDLVFQTFSQAHHLAHWWGPKGMSIHVKTLEFRPGGSFHYKMTGKDDFTVWGKFIYRDIIAPEKIVFVNSFADEEGNIIRPPFPDPWPVEIYYIFTFTEEGDKTILTVQSSAIHATAEEQQTFIHGFASMQEGFGGTFDHLKEYLASLNGSPFIIERLLNAPIDLVWKAITDKDQMKQWYFDLADFKAEVGFEFRFDGGPADGPQYHHVCKITEVIPGKTLTYSWRYEGYKGISFVTFELTPQGQFTRITLIHAGLETFPASNPDFAKQNFVQGWTEIIGTGLKAFVEK